MSRIPVVLSMVAAGMVMSASPIASATDLGQTSQSTEIMEAAMCGERSQLVADLQQQFSEAPMAVGQVDDQAVVEILVSDAGTWTILATGTDGVSCVVSAGEGFQSTSLVRGIDI
jgi:hypothetical protein